MRPLAAVLLSLLLAGCAGTDQPTESPSDEPTPSVTESSPAESSTDTLTETSSTTEPPVPTEISDDFPLAEGMSPGDDGQPAKVSDSGRGLRALRFCGERPLRGLEYADRLVASVSGPEYAMNRDLMLFSDPAQAALIATAITDAARACPSESSSPGSELLTEVRESSLGEPPASLVVHTYKQDGLVTTGAEIIQVVPVGATLLVTSAYSEWTPGVNLDLGIRDDVRRTRSVVAAMENLAGGTVAPEEDAIPEDFPLDAGLPEDADYVIEGPSPDNDGVGPVEVCDLAVWPPAPTAVDRLAVTTTGPEYGNYRELLVVPDAQTAVGVVDDVRTAVELCPVGPGRDKWVLHGVDTGYDSATFTIASTRRTSLGTTGFQLTRVGRGLLMVSVYGEGSRKSMTDAATESTLQLTSSMCAFTEAGC